MPSSSTAERAVAFALGWAAAIDRLDAERRERDHRDEVGPGESAAEEEDDERDIQVAHRDEVPEPVAHYRAGWQAGQAGSSRRRSRSRRRGRCERSRSSDDRRQEYEISQTSWWAPHPAALECWDREQREGDRLVFSAENEAACEGEEEGPEGPFEEIDDEIVDYLETVYECPIAAGDTMEVLQVAEQPDGRTRIRVVLRGVGRPMVVHLELLAAMPART